MYERPKYMIGRSMIEGTKISDYWVRRSNLVDEIWVPATFLVDVFTKSGVPPSKIKVIPLGIDTNYWNPNLYTKLSLDELEERPDDFIFLSVFKLEDRKGWDILFKSYLTSFSNTDKVTLVIQTYMYLVKGDRRNVTLIWKTFNDFIDKDAELGKMDKSKFPRIIVYSDQLKYEDMPRIYKNANAFILPTRGEGWGLPLMEAMSMELPVISTNWSGPVDFMNDDVSYLISVEKMIPVDMWGKIAQPSLEHCKMHMRDVFENREKAKLKGIKARKHIIENFDNEVVSKIVLNNFNRIMKIIKP
jgi:glycosyltransferase involved in cell wall biosynthesis